MASDDLRARLAQIRAREEAATPGPWRVENNQRDLNRWVSSDDQTLDINFGYVGNRTQNDARFVAHVREDVPWLLAEIDRLTAELDAPSARSDRCPRCLCADCGGRLDHHTDTGCSCDSCTSPELACSLREFLPDPRIGFIAEQLGPLLSTHLGEKQQRRCLAVAHAAHHALHDYDNPPERCCVCGTTEHGGAAFYENYRGQLFCWPCADGNPTTTKE